MNEETDSAAETPRNEPQIQFDFAEEPATGNAAVPTPEPPRQYVQRRPEINAPLRLNAALPLDGQLRDLRTQSGLERSAVCEATTINPLYIAALEDGEFNRLPPVVYVLAYLKRLAEFYRLSPEDTDLLTHDLRSRLEYALPDEMSKVVVDYEPSEENDSKMRTILLLLGSAAGVFVLAMALALYMIFSPSREKAPEQNLEPMPPPAGEKAFTVEDLSGLLGEPKLEQTALSPNETPRRR